MTRTRSEKDVGYTLVELLVVVLVIGVISAAAVGTFTGAMLGAHDSLMSSTLQAARVALAAATVRTGSVPRDASGDPSDLTAPLIALPATDPSFKMGYVPGCFQILSNTGASTNTWLHNGACTTADAAAGSGGAKPLLETDFVLCGQYGSNGTLYIADTWHGTAEYKAGGKWRDGSLMNLHGCTPKSIVSTGGTVPAQS